MCHRMPQKTYPVIQCAQGTCMSRAECGLILKVLPCWVGEWVTDHPVKHCALPAKMVIIIKKVIGRYKRENLSKRLGTI